MVSKIWSRKATAITVALALCIMLVAGCGPTETAPPKPPETPAPAPEPEKVVVLGMPADPSTLDPHLTGQNIDWNVCYHIFDSFVGRDVTGATVPSLAEKWEVVDPENNVWRFHLRQGVTFHNGEPWNAEVAKWNFERARTEPQSMQKRYAEEAQEITIVDEHTLDIKLLSPLSVAMGNLVQFHIVPMQYIQEVGNATFGIKPVGTGPYKFVEWVKDDHITLEANADYWGGAPEVKKAMIKPVPEPASRVIGLISGDLDVIRGVSVFDTDRIDQSGVAKVVALDGPRMWHIKLDTYRDSNSPGLTVKDSNPFQDVRVRQAMYLAIDVDTIIQQVMRGFALPASQTVAPFVWGHNPAVTRPGYDPDKARQLMADAGWSDGFGVRFDVAQGWDVVAEAIGHYLGEIGIRVEVNVVPSAVHRQLMENYDTSMAWGGWGATFVNTAFEGVVHTVDSAGGYGRANYGRYSNPELDKLIEKAAATMDPDAQLELYRQCQKMLMDDVGIIPIFHEGLIAGVRKGYEVSPTAFEHVYLHYVKIAK